MTMPSLVKTPAMAHLLNERNESAKDSPIITLLSPLCSKGLGTVEREVGSLADLTLPDHLVPLCCSAGRSQGSSTWVGSSIRVLVELDGSSSILVSEVLEASGQTNDTGQEKGGVSPCFWGSPPEAPWGWRKGTYFGWAPFLLYPWGAVGP